MIIKKEKYKLFGFFLLIKISKLNEDFLNKKIKSIYYLKQNINLKNFNSLYNKKYFNKFSLEDYLIMKLKIINFIFSNLTYKKDGEYNTVFLNNLQISY